MSISNTIETKNLILRNYKFGDEEEIIDLIKNNKDHLKYVIDDWELFPDFITFLRHHIALIDYQQVIVDNLVAQGGAS